MSRFAVALSAIAVLATAGAAVAQTTPAPLETSAESPAAARPTVDSAIKDLLAHPSTAAVLEKHLPGVGRHPALPQFQDMTLAEVAPLSDGAVTPEIIAAIDADLKALPSA